MLPLKRSGKLMFFVASTFLGANSAHSVMMRAVDHGELARVCCLQERFCGVQKAERAFDDGTRLLNLCGKFHPTVNRESSFYGGGEEDCRLLCKLALGKVRRGLYLAQKAPSGELAAPLRECENALREYETAFEKGGISEDPKVRKHLKTIDGHVRKVAKFRELLTRLNGGCEGSRFEVKKCSCELPFQHEMWREILKEAGATDLISFMVSIEEAGDVPLSWRKAFEYVEPLVSSLKRHESFPLLRHLASALECVSERFWNFSDFCSSMECNGEVQQTVVSFLELGERALHELSEESLEKELRELVHRRLQAGVPLVSEEDADLFHEIYLAFKNYLSPMRNQ